MLAQWTLVRCLYIGILQIGLLAELFSHVCCHQVWRNSAFKYLNHSTCCRRMSTWRSERVQLLTSWLFFLWERTSWFRAQFHHMQCVFAVFQLFSIVNFLHEFCTFSFLYNKNKENYICLSGVSCLTDKVIIH